MAETRRRVLAVVAAVSLSGVALGAFGQAAGGPQASKGGPAQPSWFAKTPKASVQAFKDPDGRFTFEYPKKDWMAYPGGGPIVATVASKKGDAAIIVEHAWLTQPLAPSDITELFAELEVEVVRERVPKATDFQTQVIDAGEQRLVVVQYVRQGVTGMERVRQYSIPAGRHLFRISGVAALVTFGSVERWFAHAAATFAATGAIE